MKLPILGADFLRNFSLLVDVGQKGLSDASTHLSVQGIASQATSLSLHSVRETPVTHSKLSSSSFRRSSSHAVVSSKSSMMSHTTFRPSAHLSSLVHDASPPNDSRWLDRNLSLCCSLAIGHPLFTWSPRKTPGNWQPCVDYHVLNSATVTDRYPIPHIQDFIETRPCLCLSPDPCGTCRYSQDRRDHPVRIVRIPTNALWVA